MLASFFNFGSFELEWNRKTGIPEKEGGTNWLRDNKVIDQKTGFIGARDKLVNNRSDKTKNEDFFGATHATVAVGTWQDQL